MNLDRKLDIAKQAVTSISRHDDESVANVSTTLGYLEQFIKAERQALKERKNETLGRRISRAWRAF